jgi:predicted CXXCH cytochrome family protein
LRKLLLAYLLCVGTGLVFAQITGDILGSHNLEAGGPSPIQGGALAPCTYCHAPHSSRSGTPGLWSQQLSTVSNYTLYSGTLNAVQQPLLGSVSNKCLSCHDGTVAPGQTTPYGSIKMSGSMLGQDVFGTDLSTVHPFNFKLPLDPNTPNLLGSVISGTGTGSPSVKLVNGNVQCTSCHEPHNQFIDSTTQMFLVVDNTASALCLACHNASPAPVAAKSGTTKKRDPSAGVVALRSSLANSSQSWKQGIHASASHKVHFGATVGRYATVGRNGCMSCHAPHSGAKGAALLLNTKATDQAVLDVGTRNCAPCHNGSDTISPALPNVIAEFAKPGHPFPADKNTHSTGEKALLNGNRHATCVDCHNPHSSQVTDSFTVTTLRKSQTGVTGISAADGTTVLQPAQNQYETCLRCHGTSTEKKTLTQFGYFPNFATTAGDPLNVLAQFYAQAGSAHPVMHDRKSPYAQPSLLPNIWNLDGKTQGRAIGSRILCTDCHNSDDNREFGGSGPNGPHGSIYPHILERRYEMSQVATGTAGGPGSLIQNLFLNPSPDPSCAAKSCASPYALCAKCHDLKNLIANSSFSEHGRHIKDGFSCSVCHTAHGVGAQTGSLSGERLVNFDLNVVGSYKGNPIAYNRSNNSCTLVCHNYPHSRNSPGANTVRLGK